MELRYSSIQNEQGRCLPTFYRGRIFLPYWVN